LLRVRRIRRVVAVCMPHQLEPNIIPIIKIR
jgi:hypothetical protein